MNPDHASQSAGIIAAHRALESTRPASERIVNDPYARKLIGPRCTVIGESDIPEEKALELFQSVVPGFHEYFLARTRYMDDHLQAWIDRGLEQLVIVGAGYDSRAYRHRDLATRNTPVFELDHPATQAIKKARLSAILPGPPGHVTFVPADLNGEAPGQRLLEGGYDRRLQTLFILEGVTMYIEPPAVDRFLRFAADDSGRGSGVIFDFTHPEVIDGTSERPEARWWREKANGSSEPLRFGLDNRRVESYLADRGFGDAVWVTSSDLHRTYFTGTRTNSPCTPIFTVAHACARR